MSDINAQGYAQLERKIEVNTSSDWRTGQRSDLAQAQEAKDMRIKPLEDNVQSPETAMMFQEMLTQMGALQIEVLNLARSREEKT